MRTHEGNQPDANAQIYDPEIKEHFSRMSRIYKALKPLRVWLFSEAEQHGHPVVRHLMLHHPRDPIARDTHDQFLLGPSMLIAPVIEKCQAPMLCDQRAIYLPAGEWTHLWTGEVVRGPTTHIVEAPLGYPAAFYDASDPIIQEVLTLLREAEIDIHEP